MSQKLCFVVMGFGKKMDYESRRELNLDATYKWIIKPAADAEGFRCIRADDVMHSGIIDKPMYEMLLQADLVIADISTANANAVYELGVRHALKPYSTIIMKEQDGRLYFDLNHINILSYKHLGEDIGASEAESATTKLRKLIREVTTEPFATDSPVYTFLATLQGPRLSTQQLDKLVDCAEQAANDFAALIQQGRNASKASDHEAAIAAFQQARKIKEQARREAMNTGGVAAVGPSEDAYLIQQLALATYKAGEKKISTLKKQRENTDKATEQQRDAERKEYAQIAIDSLVAARNIIAALQPENSNDPETLGIAGAIGKRLWLARADRADLDTAIRYYGRGFEVRRDYYNGENLATCLDLRANVQVDPDETKFDRMSARKTRRAVIAFLEPVVADAETLEQRLDRRWIFASLANCHYALREGSPGQEFEERFRAEHPADWEVSTFEQGKNAALSVATLP